MRSATKAGFCALATLFIAATVGSSGAIADTGAGDALNQGQNIQSTGQTATSGQDLPILQPAGESASPLQPADAGNSGLAAPSAGNLQQSGTSDEALKLIGADADQPHQIGKVSLAWLGYLLIVLLAATVITAVAWLAQRRRWPPVSLPISRQ